MNIYSIFYIKLGAVHGTYKGSILICEVQQNSDVICRVYDYGREVEGKKRTIHLEKATDIIIFDSKLDLTTAADRPEYTVENFFIDKLVSSNFYTMKCLNIRGKKMHS